MQLEDDNTKNVLTAYGNYQINDNQSAKSYNKHKKNRNKHISLKDIQNKQFSGLATERININGP